MLKSDDIKRLKKDTDILAIVGRDTNLKRVATVLDRGKEYAGPCPFCGGADRFRVQPDRGLWWCRQCSPNEHWQDAIEYVQRRDGVNFTEAVSQLSSSTLSTSFAPSCQVTWPKKEQPAGWQPSAAKVVKVGESALWADTPHSRGALDWLHRRGLNDDTLKAWAIGFNPASRKIGTLWVESGVMIPYFDGCGRCLAVNVRRPNSYLQSHPQADKYRMVTGSRRVLFGADHLAGRPDVVITEGEFDALLVWQEACDTVDVLTMGGARSTPADLWLIYLLAGQRFYVATDSDSAGDEAAARWLEIVCARGSRVSVPDAKDITEFWQHGGDIRRLMMGLWSVGNHVD